MTQDQFAGVVEQYERLVYTICYQFTKDHHLAQDLAQDTFLSAYTHLATAPVDNLKPWLARIATNKAKDHLKSAYNRRVCATEDSALPQHRPTLFSRAEQPEDITIARDEARHIAGEIQALKEPYHQVAVLFFLEDRSVEEIAKQLDRPTKTVHTQLYRAKNLLQTKLKPGNTPATNQKGGRKHDLVP